MMRKFRFWVLLGMIAAAALPVLAQDATEEAAAMPGEAVAEGLNQPRQLFIGADGTLYVAEAGTGGETAAPSRQGGGDVQVGLTSQITAVSPEGEQSVALGELLSTSSPFGAYGVGSMVVDDTSIWAVLGEGPAELPQTVEGSNFAALVQFDRETGEVLQAVDLQAFEEENNPDGAEETIANPTDIAQGADGTVYIIDASANALLTWTEADGVQVAAVWQPTEDAPQPVPTSVAVTEAGDVYVGFLSGFPFPTGGAKVEHWQGGELVNTFEGLTLVTDVVVGADGNVYAVQMAEGFGDQGYIPNSGSVVMLGEDGATPVVEGLSFPYGLAQDADGNWYVSINTAFAPPDSGAVLMLPASM
jgi:hypothetical protein